MTITITITSSSQQPKQTQVTANINFIIFTEDFVAYYLKSLSDIFLHTNPQLLF